MRSEVSSCTSMHSVLPKEGGVKNELQSASMLPKQHSKLFSSAAYAAACKQAWQPGRSTRLAVAHLAARVLPPPLLEHRHLGVLELLLHNGHKTGGVLSAKDACAPLLCLVCPPTHQKGCSKAYRQCHTPYSVVRFDN